MNTDAALVIVGDVHGDAVRLEAALRDLVPIGRRIVFVGDYVNRGADSRNVLELLVEAKSHLRDRLVLLRGNHDDALLDFLLTGRPARILQHQGLTTVQSYLGDSPPRAALDTFRQTFPASHQALLASTTTCFETDQLLVSHCGLNPAQPASRNLCDMVLGSFPRLFRGELEEGPPLVVCGHYVQNTLTSFLSQRFICVDTGCGTLPHGVLTAVMLPERAIVSY